MFCFGNNAARASACVVSAVGRAMTRKALSIPEQVSYALRVSFCAAGADRPA
jgi:hypothetical protein